MTTKVTIIGAAGRMGRRLVALTGEDPQLELTGAIEWSGSEFLGLDAGMVADGQKQGITITDDLQSVLENTDAIIDFSLPNGCGDRIQAAADAGVAYVLGTTGFSEKEKEGFYKSMEGGRFIFAPNFSVGVNLLFELCGKVARILNDDYDIEVVDMHHNQKVDSPSGTAERIGEVLADARGLDYATDTKHGRHGNVGKRTQKEIGMHALRGGDVVGDHTVIFATGGERVELTHKASSRDTFAKGALRAAMFLKSAEPGTYTMKEVLGL
ncbi:MAG: 4-hydroxy-tetrahydrodipicolinate reductase [Lentisphaeria bacterium]|nr:4-hydroxy-tetrahydrodipicolinate reductase [Lentisphaeria bacterium]